MRLRMSLLVLVSACLQLATAQTTAPVVVRTADGQVSGTEDTAANGNKFYSFLGIPFAEPPIGERRFKAPVRSKGWSGIRDGSQAPSPCIGLPLFQLLFGIPFTVEQVVGSEDCLYLNVFTPKTAIDAGGSYKRLPVMVYIHGGAFLAGSAEEYPPHVFLSKDIVYVVIQYRLGFLGFLSTDDCIMPGNYGLKDQTLALQWVQRHIHNFGGDRRLVTIFGQSAGATSVHYQILSPKARGLFTAAITQSGNALMPWATYNVHRRTAEQVGNLLGCSLNGGSIAYLACMQAVDPKQLNLVATNLAVWLFLPPLGVPRVDGDFIPDYPMRLVKEGRYNKVNLISGVTSHEAGFITQQMYNSQPQLVQQLQSNFPVVGPLTLGYLPEQTNAVYATEQTYNYYLGNVSNVGVPFADNMTRMMSDNLFILAHDLNTIFHARESRVSTYRYEFTHLDPTLFDMTGFGIGRHWVTHNAELPFQSQPQPLPVDNNDVQAVGNYKVMNLMLDLWTNFATYGDPTPTNSLGFKWEKATPDNLQYLDINPNPVMKPDNRVESRNFLLSLPTETNAILNEPSQLRGHGNVKQHVNIRAGMPGYGN